MDICVHGGHLCVNVCSALPKSPFGMDIDAIQAPRSIGAEATRAEALHLQLYAKTNHPASFWEPVRSGSRSLEKLLYHRVSINSCNPQYVESHASRHLHEPQKHLAMSLARLSQTISQMA